MEHQLAGRRLFDAYRGIEAARLMLAKSAWLMDQGRHSIERAFAARAQACETAMRVTADMMLLHGGFGVTREYAVEKYYRDAAPLQIMDGSVDRIAVVAAERL
ncbi:MAG: acyl-CoA dehydrogenase family protein [Acidimicrobiia bacterium]|nr:acyl-CoA dehydrogenase family protein [Acidimicrobiia bacterium]